MSEIFTSFASEAKVNEETIQGLQSIEYRFLRNRHDIGAIGTDERIGSYQGMRLVSGRLRVASANRTLDDLLDSGEGFTISATLKHGDASRSITFDDCFLDEKAFALSTQAHGETIYSFSATRVRG
jgi:hypothetical protein